jgi:hypothetical protein
MVALIVPDVAPRHRLFPDNRGREENRKIARISNLRALTIQTCGMVERYLKIQDLKQILNLGPDREGVQTRFRLQKICGLFFLGISGPGSGPRGISHIPNLTPVRMLIASSNKKSSSSLSKVPPDLWAW